MNNKAKILLVTLATLLTACASTLPENENIVPLSHDALADYHKRLPSDLEARHRFMQKEPLWLNISTRITAECINVKGMAVDVIIPYTSADRQGCGSLPDERFILLTPTKDYTVTSLQKVQNAKETDNVYGMAHTLFQPVLSDIFLREGQYRDWGIFCADNELKSCRYNYMLRNSFPEAIGKTLTVQVKASFLLYVPSREQWVVLIGKNAPVIYEGVQLKSGR